MRCRDFERQLMDWLAHKLTVEQAELMDAHQSSCASCARLTADERDMLARWKTAKTVEPPHDLWPMVSTRIHAPEPRMQWFKPRRFVLAGTLAASIALGVMFGRTPTTELPPPPPNIATADEGKVVKLVADMQELPDVSNDKVLPEPLSYSGGERALFISEGQGK